MNSNVLGSSDVAIVGVIDPDLNAAGSFYTGWISAVDFARFLVVVSAGSLGSSATLDAKIQQASDSAGTGAKDMAAKVIAQMTAGDKQSLINLRPGELDIANGFTHFRAALTIGVASSDSAMTVLGIGPMYGPATQAATVAEVVS